jgi:hypothetical protein
MEPKKESPRFILILGSLFLLAYAAYNLGIAWMDSVPGNSLTPLAMAHTPTPSDLVPSATPTNVPLRWITPTITNSEKISTLGTTNDPGNALSKLPSDEAYPGALEEAYPGPEADDVTNTPTITPTPASIIATATPIPTNTPTSTPTNDGPYPGPGEGGDPYPGPEETPVPTVTSDSNSYPGPEKTATPPPTPESTTTKVSQQPSPTPSATGQSSTPGTTPTPLASLPPTGTQPPVINTLAYTDTQIISNGAVNQAIWLEDEALLALATSNGLYLYNLSLGRSHILDARFSMSSVAFMADDLIAAGGQDGVIRIWDTYDDSFVTRLNGHLLGVIRLAYSQLAEFLASASDDATVRIWDYDGSPLFTFHDPVTRVTDMAISPNGQMVAATSNRHVHIWNPLSGALSKMISQPSGWYTAAVFSPNSQVLCTAFDGLRLEFWQTATWERTDFLGLDAEVLSLTYSPNGRLLAISYNDGSIQILDADSHFLLADVVGYSNLTSMAFNTTSDQLLTSNANGSIRIWDVSPLVNP